MLNIPIAQPPWTHLGKKIESAVRKALYEFDMIADNTSVVAVALSGGKDSLTLLFILHAISGRGFAPFKLVALHVQGEFSCGAQVSGGYLETICKKLDVPFIPLSSDKKQTLECYSCSRERRSLIFQEAKKQGATIIAFGHHQDDNVQTTLMNLFHKGEFAGTLPKIHMHEYGVTIIRPLLYIAENDIREFAKLYEFIRITCQCPVGQQSMRKKTEELLQMIEVLYPNVRTNIAQSVLRFGSQKANNTPKRTNLPVIQNELQRGCDL